MGSRVERSNVANSLQNYILKRIVGSARWFIYILTREKLLLFPSSSIEWPLYISFVFVDISNVISIEQFVIKKWMTISTLVLSTNCTQLPNSTRETVARYPRHFKIKNKK